MKFNYFCNLVGGWLENWRVIQISTVAVEVEVGVELDKKAFMGGWVGGWLDPFRLKLSQTSIKVKI